MSIKDEYSKPVKPLIKSKTFKDVFVATLAIALNQIVIAVPAVAMMIFALLPEWLHAFVTLDAIQLVLQNFLLLIAGYAGIDIIKERIEKGDISGVVKAK